jgi:hypothetical protein
LQIPRITNIKTLKIWNIPKKGKPKHLRSGKPKEAEEAKQAVRAKGPK